MTIASVAIGDSGASVRAKINAAIDGVNGIGADIGAGATHPGDNPDAFTSALTGDPKAKAGYAETAVDTTTGGRVIVLSGAGKMAMRHPLRIEPGHRYLIRAVVRRTTNTPDPAGDSVSVKIQWQDASFATISTATLVNITDLTTTSGRVEKTFRIAGGSGSDINAVWPAGAAYAVAYVETFGSGGATAVETVEGKDLTNLTIDERDVGALATEIEELAADLTPRVEALEGQVGTDTRLVFDTKAAAEAATVGTTVKKITLLGYAAADDEGGGEYRRVSSEPAHEGKFETANGIWFALTGATVRPEQFGAKGDGATNDRTAFENAMTIGRPIVGDPSKWYAISGNMAVAEGTNFRSTKFKQLVPSTTNCRTLFADGVDNIKFVDVVVDRNGNGTNGALFTHAGIYINGGSGHKLKDCEVFGDDMGNGIILIGASDFHVVRPYVHDINYSLASNPGDDRIHGIIFQNCTNGKLQGHRVQDLGGNFGSGATTRWSRGVTLGGCSDIEIIGGTCERVDQAYDFTGSDGNRRVRVVGAEAKDAYSWGFKAANTAIMIDYIGCHAYRCGYAGFVASGPAESGLASPRSITFTSCKAIDTGSNGAWAAQFPVGFLVLKSDLYDTSRPRPVRFIGCEAIDDQNTPTMSNGFRNQPAGTAAGQEINETINCISRGHISAPFVGFNYPACKVRRSTTQSIPNNTATAIAWDAEIYDGALMHSTVSNTELVTPPRPGYYRAKAQITFAGNATGYRYAAIKVSGVVDDYSKTLINGSSSDTTIIAETTAYMGPGSNFQVEVYQNSGGSLNILAISSLEVVEVMAQGS